MALTNCDSHKHIRLSDGLEYEEYTYRSVRVSVLKISPDRFRFEYHTSRKPMTPEEWLAATSSVAVINAGMYAEDNFQHVGEVVFRNNRMPSIPMKGYQGIFAFDPRYPGFPKAAIFDLNCTPLTYIKQNYRSYIQNMRFTSCVDGEQLWHRWKKSHSMSILGQDSAGNILLIFTPSDISPRNFRELLRNLGVGLKNSVYLEGGKEAGMAVEYGRFKFVGFSRGKPFPIPNVITVHPLKED